MLHFIATFYFRDLKSLTKWLTININAMELLFLYFMPYTYMHICFLYIYSGRRI